jgi:FAD-dependent oxidoreductase domain-containing protein 1
LTEIAAWVRNIIVWSTPIRWRISMLDQAGEPQVIIIGAGILGLASAYHILQNRRNLDLLVIDRLQGAGRGNTARSAAAYRDMFSSPVNRALSQGSIVFYEQVQKETNLGLKRIGYLWLRTADQIRESQATLDSMARAGVQFRTLEPEELNRRFPGMRTGTISQGLLGRNCGILNPNLLCRFYEQQILALGGRFAYGVEVTGFATNPEGRILGVKVGETEIIFGTIVVATGAWLGLTMRLARLKVPVVPRKRQLFAVAATAGPLQQLLHAGGFNAYNVLPFTIMPGGAYLRPATGSFILGYANEDQPPGLEDHPAAERDFFEARVRPQVEPYFPAFREARPEYAWAGHYADHVADSHPIVDRSGGTIIVGGDSGSGIMKADSLGRIVAGLYSNRDRVELGDGQQFRVADLGLANRRVVPEELVI